MFTLLAKMSTSILLITSFHNCSAVENVHYVLINNQFPKITRVTYENKTKKQQIKKVLKNTYIKPVETNKKDISAKEANKLINHKAFGKSLKQAKVNKPVKKVIKKKIVKLDKPVVYKKAVSAKKPVVRENKPATAVKTVKSKASVSKPAQTAQNGHTVTMSVSAYTSQQGIGNGLKCADGTVPIQGITIAAGSKYPFGTKMLINGHIYTVHDRGGAIGDSNIDLFMNSETAAKNFGRQELQVTVLPTSYPY